MIIFDCPVDSVIIESKSYFPGFICKNSGRKKAQAIFCTFQRAADNHLTLPFPYLALDAFIIDSFHTFGAVGHRHGRFKVSANVINDYYLNLNQAIFQNNHCLFQLMLKCWKRSEKTTKQTCVFVVRELTLTLL